MSGALECEALLRKRVLLKQGDQPSQERRWAKYAAAAINATPATTHQSAGRERFTPAIIPREQATAAQSMVSRLALNWNAGGLAGVEDEIMKLGDVGFTALAAGIFCRTSPKGTTAEAAVAT